MQVYYVNIYCPISRGLAKDFDVLKSCLANLNKTIVFYHNCIFKSVFINGREYLPSQLNKLKFIKYKFRYSFFLRTFLFRKKCFDLSIAVERLHYGMTCCNKYTLLVPNLEWFRFVEKKAMNRVTHILAKTQEAQSVCSEIFSQARIIHTSFTSPNVFKKEVKKAKPLECIHVGGSHQKGTEGVVALWSQHPEWPQLHLVTGKYKIRISEDLKNITHYTDHLSDDSFIQLSNQCLVHICPSRVEGFGHTLNEGMACGALVITTDASPMNEVVPKSISQPYGINTLCRASFHKKQYEGMTYTIDIEHLEELLTRVFDLPHEQLIQCGEMHHTYYLERDTSARKKIIDTLDSLLN